MTSRRRRRSAPSPWQLFGEQILRYVLGEVRAILGIMGVLALAVFLAVALLVGIYDVLRYLLILLLLH
jgi:hypothetical protein